MLALTPPALLGELALGPVSSSIQPSPKCTCAFVQETARWKWTSFLMFLFENTTTGHTFLLAEKSIEQIQEVPVS